MLPFVFAPLLLTCSGGAPVASDGERYLALGDSFTIGTGTTSDRSFPAVLVARWRAAGREVALTNPAANGYATDELIARELPLARQVRPTLVTVLIGANDIVRGSTDERYRAQLRRIQGGLAEVGVPASAIYALPQPDWSRSPASAAFGAPSDLFRVIERFNAIAKQEVERARGTYVDVFPLMRSQAERGLVAPDGLHPSARAYAEWAAALEGSLTSAR